MPSHVIFYHYTRRSNKKNIIVTREIWETKRENPHFGSGTYGTTLGPSAGKEVIARNNWTYRWKCKLEGGYVNYAIWVKIPKHEVKYYNPDNRKIVVHEGPIRLRGRIGGNWGVKKVVDP